MRAGIVQPGEQKAAVGLISVYSTTGVWSQTAKKTELFFFFPYEVGQTLERLPKGAMESVLGYIQNPA